MCACNVTYFSIQSCFSIKQVNGDLLRRDTTISLPLALNIHTHFTQAVRKSSVESIQGKIP